jgi:isoleucyl-tRNA synthetase
MKEDNHSISNVSSKANHSEGLTSIARNEELLLEFWNEQDIFAKTLKKDSLKGDFVFYEGPPTANGKPGIHHLESRAFKDVIPRYKTMQGYRVRRKAGWDTHGLPVELQMEKKLGLSSKKEIEAYGIASFNTACRESVLQYIDLWDKFTKRIGYWVDQEDAYYTFDNSYIESLWWVLSEIEQKGLLYKDYKVVPWCPRCGTALSTHELGQPEAYVDVKDLSVTAKFELVDNPGTFVLAWTTTPWTLPGNVGLAVGEDIDYVKIKKDESYYIIAKARLESYARELGEAEIVDSFKGSELEGLSYRPLFPYFEDLAEQKNISNVENAYKIYRADFVTTEDGTGVVHTAVMYGAEDFELGTKVGLPKMHVVDESGMFIAGMEDFSGKFVKDESTNVDIIKSLSQKGLLFSKQKYEHPYPHCWRCKTPLIYYARDSWYIRVSHIKDALISENQAINWEPAHIKDGRFGEWLNGIKDWAISRERYWGTPLPIWVNDDGEKIIIDSIDRLKQFTRRSGLTVYAMRHGEAESNVLGICSSRDREIHPLTQKGKEQVLDAVSLITSNVDVIISSPLLRTRQSAEIVAQHFGVSTESIVYDERLAEINFGDFEGKLIKDFVAYRDQSMSNFDDPLPQGESYQDVKNRIGDVMYSLENEYPGKTVCIVTHGASLEVIPSILSGETKKESLKTRQETKVGYAHVVPIDFTPLPHNDLYELDLHRPYIDEVCIEKEGKVYRRVPEVMDVWFDSGAMPFAQDHYPFEHKEWIDTQGFPADYISEAIDQTRGWFYTLHAIGNLLGKGRAYNNVICLGHLLDAQGKKMSKSLGNVIDPWEAMETWGADTLRFWMYSVTGPGDSKNFDPKTVDETQRKVFNLLRNISSFYDMYADKGAHTSSDPMDVSQPQHVLDVWIYTLLGNLIEDVTDSYDRYDITRAARLIKDFIGELSQWYVRRSRDRFKSDPLCQETLRKVLHVTSRLMAPLTPFISEELFQKTRGNACPESVHLASWPLRDELPLILESYSSLLSDMDIVRESVSKALELRDTAGIKVRQPLSRLEIPEDNWVQQEDLIDIIREEVNVKEVVSREGSEYLLDTTITDELRKEGIAREIIRTIQATRKDANLMPEDVVSCLVQAPSNVRNAILEYEGFISSSVNARELSLEDGDDIRVTLR